ncbi:MAG: HAMP domain-containing histidine kinase [Magnetococcus sp. DMHC-6]
MQRRHNLRFRVGIAFACFGAIVSLLLATALQFATHDLSQRLIDETLSAELDDYFARRQRNPHSLPPKTVVLHGYVQNSGQDKTEIPNYLQTLPTGRFDLTIGDLPYRVVVEDREGSRYYLLYDTSLQQRREHRFTILLGAYVVTILLVSALGGIWLVEMIIAPVTKLANQVRTRKPDIWSLKLADDFDQDEVGELAHAFDNHLARIRGFMERERAFTADLSHELRTSLAVILSATEILLSDETLSEKQIKRITRIDRASHDMAEMGTALLLMSREEHSLSIDEQTRPTDVINEAIEKHHFLLKNKPIHLEITTDPTLLLAADRGLVYIVIANLIRNAFSYTEQGAIKIIQDQSTLSIQDTGCGIRSHQVESVFLRHFRASSQEGAGIGLSLVKRICNHYDWKIQMESQEGMGTNITIYFFPG